MTIDDLATRYQAIGKRLRARAGNVYGGGDVMLHALGADYAYVVSLLTPNEESSPHLDLVVSQLRRRLNRSPQYAWNEKRNKTLAVMAETIERVEEENWSIMDEYFNYRDYPGGF